MVELQYIVITDLSLKEVILHHNNRGLPTTATTTNDIYDGFGHDGRNRNRDKIKVKVGNSYGLNRNL
jgi:hypothetical protein